MQRYVGRPVTAVLRDYGQPEHRGADYIDGEMLHYRRPPNYPDTLPGSSVPSSPVRVFYIGTDGRVRDWSG